MNCFSDLHIGVSSPSCCAGCCCPSSVSHHEGYFGLFSGISRRTVFKMQIALYKNGRQSLESRTSLVKSDEAMEAAQFITGAMDAAAVD